MSYRIISSSPAKVIISGEHSVIYGNNTISSAIDMHNETTGEYTFKGDKEEVAIHLVSGSTLETLSLPKGPISEFLHYILLHETDVDQLAAFTIERFGEARLLFGMSFVLTVRSFRPLISPQSVPSLVARLLEYDATLTCHSKVPMDSGLGSSASFFSSLMINIYVRIRCNERLP